ncbi:putative membrane protein [Thermotoga neapolitana DSM 4359]|uniref:Uncharacterized protein n=1 Tax=Thermotoga neapolitana (strain ATCC 49049 / DSM 4359 / NBRC 107923 / NS-E) TaxID=309803 RepID=B9K872_THENN|nr:Putative uncharacterized protein [Thermotoga neapolitana DSM 4359]MDK2785779.1 hypothetical protein [Thermotoga sp.]HBF11566.1 hypothetical protein [Thermotoga neapolitana]
MSEEGERLRFFTQLLSILLIVVGTIGFIGWVAFYFLEPYISTFLGVSVPKNFLAVLLSLFLPFLFSGISLNYYTSSGKKWLAVLGFLLLFPSLVAQLYGLYVFGNLVSRLIGVYVLFLLFTVVLLAFFLTVIRRDES